MKDTVSKVLFSLSETDKNIQELTQTKEETELERKTLIDSLNLTKSRLEQVEGLYRESESQRVLEEHRLREEEQKIVERRKQLTSLGGAKSAKLVEREIDIASRALETLEKNLLDATGSVDELEVKRKDFGQALEELQKKYEEIVPSAEKTIEEINGQLEGLGKEHKALIAKIDDRLKNLYRRVNNRYPGQAVALAKNGSCRSCYRALPAQLYNQVMAGNRLIQCPGCSRILVYSETENGG